MSKRHHSGDALLSQLIRCQELILARTGVDEFYETIRLLIAKSFWEKSNSVEPLCFETAQHLLTANGPLVDSFVEGGALLCAPAEVAEECLRLLAPTRISATSYEVLHTAFEQMTSKQYKSDKGQYFTPSHVVDFCISVLRPAPGELICDPACGSGAFLKSAYDSIGKPLESKTIFGFDISKRASKTASLLSYFACNGSVRIGQIDSLQVGGSIIPSPDSFSIEDFMREEIDGFGGFDVIATNPPFAGDVSNASFLDHYQTATLGGARVERDTLFLERCIRLLKPGGRLAIVLPDNKISGTKFANLRKWLLTTTQVKAAVSLHSYTFRPFTSQKACVLFAVKSSKPDPTALIHLYRSDKSGKSSNGDLVEIDGKIDHDLTEITNDLTLEWKIA